MTGLIELIHTSDGKLVPNDPYIIPGTSFKYTPPRTAYTRTPSVVYINEATVIATKGLRENYKFSNNVYIAHKPDGGPGFHTNQKNLELIEFGNHD